MSEVVAGVPETTPGSPNVVVDFVRGSTVVAVGAVVGGLLEYAIRLGIARYLGPRDFGLFNIGYTVFVVFGVLAVVGTNTSVARAVSGFVATGERSRLKGTLLTGLAFVVTASLVCAVALSLAAAALSRHVWHQPELTPILVGFAWLLPLWGLHQVFLAGLRGLKAMPAMAASQYFVEPGVRGLLVLVGALAGLGTAGVIGAYYVSLAAGVAVAAVLLYRHVRPWLRTVRATREAGALGGYTSAVTYADLLNFLRATGIVLLLAHYASPAEVGVFAAATVFLLVFQMPLLVFKPLFLPVIAQLLARGEIPEARRLYRAESRWFFVLGLPLFLLVLLLPDRVQAVPFGAAFGNVGELTRILAAGAFVNVASGHCGEFLLATGRGRVIAGIRTIFFAVSVALSLALMPDHGAVGAAVALSVSLSLESVSQVAYLFRRWGVQPLSGFHRTFGLATVALFAAAWAVARYAGGGGGWVFVVALGSASVVTVLGLPFVAGLHPEDRHLVESMWRRLRRGSRVDAGGAG